MLLSPAVIEPDRADDRVRVQPDPTAAPHVPQGHIVLAVPDICSLIGKVQIDGLDRSIDNRAASAGMRLNRKQDRCP